MRILLVGSQEIFVHDLKWGYEQLGCSVKVNNNIKKKELAMEIEAYDPDLVMTFGTPIYYNDNPEIIQLLGERSSEVRYQYIHWDTDGILNARSHQLPLILKVKPDKVFTPCRQAQKIYAASNIKTGIMRYGISTEMFYKAPRNPEYEQMITYIAGFYKGRIKQKKSYKAQSLEALFGGVVQHGIKIDLWGALGLQTLYSYWTENVPTDFYHGGCRYDKLKEIYSNCYINLATQNGESHITKRTYDILGSAGFALTYKTPGVEEEFENGKELIAVTSAEESLYYIEYYKKNRKEYDMIRENGYKKVVENYTYKHRLQNMLAEIN